MDNKIAKILYVEDDADLGFLTKDFLEQNGFEVNLQTDGLEGRKAFDIEKFDLCILDVMMPKMDGFELAKYIREKNLEIPLIFLTAKQMKEDKIEGLTLGADDYITKPYDIDELILKIKIFLKRKEIIKPVENILNIAQYIFNYQELSLHIGNETRKLTQREADLLLALYKSKNVICRRDELLMKIWGKDDYFLGRSMDVFISRLRKYLKDDPDISIENIHGVGFIFRF
jgi:two-component system, OmpR family, response regulator VicR